MQRGGFQPAAKGGDDVFSAWCWRRLVGRVEKNAKAALRAHPEAQRGHASAASGARCCSTVGVQQAESARTSQAFGQYRLQHQPQEVDAGQGAHGRLVGIATWKVTLPLSSQRRMRRPCSMASSTLARKTLVSAL